MALGLGKRTTRQQSLTPEPGAFPLLIDDPEYQPGTTKIHGLERLLLEKGARLEQLHEERRRLRSSSFVDFLTTKFLSSGSDAGEASFVERIALLNDEIRAVTKAIELASHEQDKVRNRLSAQMREVQLPYYRQQLRQVLAGALQLEAGNRAVVTLREDLERAGYRAAFLVPAMLCPWPYWGKPEDSASLWSMHLNDLLERGIIDRDEFESILAGDFGFKP